MKLQTLHELNAERAARRPVIVITDVENGEQRLVKARDFASDPLGGDLARQLRTGKSGMIEAGGKKLFLNVYAPTAKLVIVGADPSPAVCALATLPGVTVTGSVPDVRAHLRRSAAMVAPLRIARGTQNKILEAMAAGVPVVTSMATNRSLAGPR